MSPIYPMLSNLPTDPFINLTSEFTFIHTNLFAYDAILLQPADSSCIGPRRDLSLLLNLHTFITNNVLTIKDLVWPMPEDYED